MADLLAALGLALVIEGVLFALFPDAMRRALADVAASPGDRIRIVGLGSALFGVGLVWAARRLGL